MQQLQQSLRQESRRREAAEARCRKAQEERAELAAAGASPPFPLCTACRDVVMPCAPLGLGWHRHMHWLSLAGAVSGWHCMRTAVAMRRRDSCSLAGQPADA